MVTVRLLKTTIAPTGWRKREDIATYRDTMVCKTGRALVFVAFLYFSGAEVD